MNINYWRWTIPPPPLPPLGTISPALSSPQPSIPGEKNPLKVQDLDQTQLLSKDVSQPNKSLLLPWPAHMSHSSFMEQRVFMSCERNHPPNIRNLLMSTYISIMPKVEDILRLTGSGELCRDLVKKFFLPEFFFRRLGWNANGMFGSIENLSQSDKEKSYGMRPQKNFEHSLHSKYYKGTFSRFLSKKVKEKPTGRTSTPGIGHDEDPALPPITEYDYNWHFMAFCTLWRSSRLDSETDNGPAKTEGSTNATNILVCFDLDDESVLQLRHVLQNADLRKWEEEPFLMLEFALSIVVEQCEDDLWSFQEPVRNIERVLFALPLLQDYIVYLTLNNL